MAKTLKLVTLPPYTRVNYSPKTGLATFRWELNGHLRKSGFEPKDERLGSDPRIAFKRVEEVLKPALDRHLANGQVILMNRSPAPDAIDALFDSYRKDPTFTDLAPRTQGAYNKVLNHASVHVFRDGPEKGQRFGALPIARVTVQVARILVDEYTHTTKTDPATGAKVPYRRDTTAKHLKQTVSTCFNSMYGVHPLVPAANPFARVRRKDHHQRRTYAATIENLAMFDFCARNAEMPNAGTGALTAYELEMRVESILTKFDCAHWKPADHPDEVLVTHWKTGETRWVYLKDADGEPLYGALEARLDALKGDRTRGILIPRDGTVDTPWALPDQSLSKFYPVFRDIANRAGLPKECTFTSFRHGGITEAAEAGCTEDELMALSGHKDPRTVRRYIKQTRRLFEHGQRKRLVHRSRVIDGLRRTGKLSLIDDAGVTEVLDKLPSVPKPVGPEGDQG
jgi:integrase